MSQLKQALLIAASTAKLGVVSTDASAACISSNFGVSLKGSGGFFTAAATDTSGKSATATETPASIDATKLTSTSTIDFTVTGIDPLGVSTVFIAYSTAKAAAGAWPASCQGKLELSNAELEIVYGQTINASQPIVGKVSMGTVVPGTISETISIRTDDLLANTKLKGNKLYFQAIVVPGTGVSIPNATVTPVVEVNITRGSTTTPPPSTGK